MQILLTGDSIKHLAPIEEALILRGFNVMMSSPKLGVTSSGCQLRAGVIASSMSKEHGMLTCTITRGIDIPALPYWRELIENRNTKEAVTPSHKVDALSQLCRHLPEKARNAQWKEAAAIALNGEVLFSTSISGIEGIISKTYCGITCIPEEWPMSLWIIPQISNTPYTQLSPEQHNYIGSAQPIIIQSIFDYLSYYTKQESSRSLSQ
jgi:hypothetical protein